MYHVSKGTVFNISTIGIRKVILSVPPEVSESLVFDFLYIYLYIITDHFYVSDNDTIYHFDKFVSQSSIYFPISYSVVFFKFLVLS